MRACLLLMLTLAGLALGGCTMPGAPDAATPLETGAGERAAVKGDVGVTTPDPAAPPAAAAPAAGKAPLDAPPMSDPLPPEPLPARAASAPDRSCRSDADCAVKDVGSCCGAMPACVNVNARPDPAAVQAQCAKQGMSSICGFKEVSGCSCVAGTCQDVAGAVAQ